MNIKLAKSQKIKIGSSDDIYSVMQSVLLRECRIDRDREHFWTVCLDNALRITNIEMVSMGTINKVLVQPMEVFSIPLQKRAVKIVLIHNHPSGEIKPSEADKDITDNLIQVGLMMKTPILDHLIITEKSFYSFADSGLLAELALSEKYVPAYILEDRYEKRFKQKIKQAVKDARKSTEKALAKAEKSIENAGKDKAKEMARAMKKNGEGVEIIAMYTGLSKAVISKLKVD